MIFFIQTNGGNMRIAASILLLFCFAGSSDAQSTDESYREIKLVATAMYNNGAYDEGEFYIDNSASGEIFLQGCSMAGLSGGYLETSADFKNSALEQIAMQVLTMSGTLRQEGYDGSTWSPILDQFERNAINAANGIQEEIQYESFFDLYFPLRQQAVDELASLLGTSPRTNRVISTAVDGECGDGGVSVLISTEPPGGRIWLISEFDFRICENKGIDPWSSGRCRVREYTDTEIGLVSGNYQFLAEWPDGTSRRGSKSFLDEFDRSGSDHFRIVQ